MLYSIMKPSCFMKRGQMLTTTMLVAGSVIMRPVEASFVDYDGNCGPGNAIVHDKQRAPPRPYGRQNHKDGPSEKLLGDDYTLPDHDTWVNPVDYTGLSIMVPPFECSQNSRIWELEDRLDRFDTSCRGCHYYNSRYRMSGFDKVKIIKELKALYDDEYRIKNHEQVIERYYIYELSADQPNGYSHVEEVLQKRQKYFETRVQCQQNSSSILNELICATQQQLKDISLIRYLRNTRRRSTDIQRKFLELEDTVGMLVENLFGDNGKWSQDKKQNAERYKSYQALKKEQDSYPSEGLPIHELIREKEERAILEISRLLDRRITFGWYHFVSNNLEKNKHYKNLSPFEYVQNMLEATWHNKKMALEFIQQDMPQDMHAKEENYRHDVVSRESGDEYPDGD